MAKTKKTDEERLAEIKIKEANLLKRMAKKDASSNPELAAIIEARDKATKLINSYSVKMGDGPQSFEARIQQHNLWIDEIAAAERLAHTDRAAEVKLRDFMNNKLEYYALNPGEDIPSIADLCAEFERLNSTTIEQVRIDSELYNRAQIARKENKSDKPDSSSSEYVSEEA